MRKVLGSVGATLLLAAPAFAADIAATAPPTSAPAVAAVPPWTGFYFGGNLGWAFGHATWCTDATIVNCTTRPVDVVTQDPTSAVGGGQVGGRWQFNNIVIGAEGMFDATSLSATTFGIVPGFPAFARSITFNNLFSATGQLGFTWGQALIYGKGGWAGTNLEFSAASVRGLNLNATRSVTNGWTAGGGIEYMILPYMSVGIEYDFYRFDRVDNIINIANTGGVLIPCAFCAINTNVQTVTGRLNFKLDALGWFR